MVEAHEIEHSRVCGSDDTYCGHPHQDGVFNFGNGEVAVLHKHSPCDYASRYNVGHGVVHSRAKVVMQRSLDGGETWEDLSDDLVRLSELPHLGSAIVQQET